jgi:hypothetical protein
MFVFAQQARRALALSLASCLALVSIGPSVAIACEGGGETQKVSLKPIAWGGGGACPEKEGKVHFTVVGQWCEYEVKNGNAVETVTIEEGVLTFETACTFGGGVFCLSIKTSAKTPECKHGLVLAVSGECYSALEYIKKPASKSETAFRVKTESAPNKVVAEPEVHQLVE